MELQPVGDKDEYLLCIDFMIFGGIYAGWFLAREVLFGHSLLGQREIPYDCASRKSQVDTGKPSALAALMATMVLGNCMYRTIQGKSQESQEDIPDIDIASWICIKFYVKYGVSIRSAKGCI